MARMARRVPLTALAVLLVSLSAQISPADARWRFGNQRGFNVRITCTDGLIVTVGTTNPARAEPMQLTISSQPTLFWQPSLTMAQQSYPMWATPDPNYGSLINWEQMPIYETWTLTWDTALPENALVTVDYNGFAENYLVQHCTLKDTPDFDGDVLWYNQDTTALVKFLVKGNQTVLRHDFGVQNDPNFAIVQVADFNGDGQRDLLRQHRDTGELQLNLLHNATVSYKGAFLHDGLPQQVAPGAHAERVLDFSGDEQYDLLLRDAATGENEAWLISSEDLFWRGSIRVVEPQWRVVTSGDYDGDSRDDLLWRNTQTGEILVGLTNGPEITSPMSLNDQIIGSGNFQGDLADEILVRDRTTGLVQIRTVQVGAAVSFGDVSDAASRAAVRAPIDRQAGPSSDWRIDDVRDFDGDGKDDILWYDHIGGAVDIAYMNNTRARIFASWGGSWRILGNTSDPGLTAPPAPATWTVYLPLAMR